LLRHNTQISGSTLYLSDVKLLPLSDLVILGSISLDTSPDELDRLLALAARTVHGACLRVDMRQCDRAAVQRFAEQLRRAIAQQTTMEHIPLVLLVRENLGKVLGQLVTAWGRAAMQLVVIDEIDARDTQFASIGRLHQGVLPVSFHGLSASHK
jgi:ethanolamine utilization protein EutA